MIPGSRGRRKHLQAPCFAIDGHIHEEIERGRDCIRNNAERLQGFGQIAETPPMNRGIGIEIS